jgi:hypothetical protein
MLKQFLILCAILGACVLFMVIGLPLLKHVKNMDRTSVDLVSIEGVNLTGGRVIVVDLTVESPCKNMMTDEPLDKCQSAQGCNTVCRLEGCESFGLMFINSSYADRQCNCTCFEENKIKSALSPK